MAGRTGETSLPPRVAGRLLAGNQHMPVKSHVLRPSLLTLDTSPFTPRSLPGMHRSAAGAAAGGGPIFAQHSLGLDQIVDLDDRQQTSLGPAAGA